METSLPPERDPAGIVWMKRGLVGFVSFAVILGLYVGYWKIAAYQLEAGLDGWTAARRAEGIDIGWQTRRLTGFPMKLQLRFEEFSVTTEAGGDTWHWRVPEVTAWATPWRLGRVDYALNGVQTLAAGPERLVVASDELKGRITVAGTGGEVGSLKLAVAALAVERNGKPEARARRFDLDLAWDAGAGAEPEDTAAPPQKPLVMDLGIDGAELPPAWWTPFGREAATLRLAAHLTGPAPAGPAYDAFQQWRDEGGTLEVTRLAADMGALKVEAEGTAALDRDMQPEGAFTVRAERYLETVEALVKAHLMRPMDGTAAKLVLAVIAKRPNGGAPYVETPVSVQNRTLAAGELRLLRLPRLDWQALGGLVLPGGGGER
jgi:hypothetical protein